VNGFRLGGLAAALLLIAAVAIGQTGSAAPSLEGFMNWWYSTGRGTGNVPAEAQVKRCYAKLHACFHTGDLSKIFNPVPFDENECKIKCDAYVINAPIGTNACSPIECASRCAVAFGVVPPPCE
jgi:hypothetical protein